MGKKAKTLVPGLRRFSSGSKTYILDPRLGTRLVLPPRYEALARRALESGVTRDRSFERWLEARHLIYSKRVRRVEAWAAARMAPAAGGRAVDIPPGARFRCQGCGFCCETYPEVTAFAADRARILAGAAALAPHVETPVERWFASSIKTSDDGLPVYALAKTPRGTCIFLARDGLCEIQRHLGAEAKPVGCQAFPLRITTKGPTAAASLRPECPLLWRSFDEAPLLSEQRPWIDAMLARGHWTSLGGIVPIAGDLYVPFPLARAFERRAIAIIQESASLEAALASIRDLAGALARNLCLKPEPGDLDRAEAAITTGDLETHRRAMGPPDILGGRASLETFLADYADVISQSHAAQTAAGARPPLLREQDRCALDMIDQFRTSLVAHRDRPIAPQGNVETAHWTRAVALDDTPRDAAVEDFVRAMLLHHLYGARPFHGGMGLQHGLAELTFTFLLARFGARLFAARREAPAATRRDWNEALGLIDRSARLTGRSQALLHFYEAYSAAVPAPVEHR